MRVLVALGCLLLVGCTGPHSTGALWAQQNLEQETALFRLSDAQRADRARAFELSLADETLASERARIESGLQDCPASVGQPRSLAVSVGDRARDALRIRAQADPVRLNSLALVALADWRLRRARATGDAQFCADARQALAGPAISDFKAADTEALTDLLTGLGTATVTRDPRLGSVADEAWPPSVALSNYALGLVDTVQARAPLPQYLAAVYGGELLGPSVAPALQGETPESVVDRLAPAYPEWEPDALYAAIANGHT
ncbi:MAG: hypothetical protein ACR2IK_11955 [Chloroflexota bacterium]